MPIKVTCPKCGGVLHAPDDAGGKRGRCPTCATVLAIPAEDPKPAAGPTSRSSLAGSLQSGHGHGGRPAESVAPFSSPGHGATVDVKHLPAPGGTYAMADADARRASGDRLSGTGDVPEPRRPLNPPTRQQFAAPAAASDEPVEVTARGWRRVRGGLAWVRGGWLFLALAVIAPAGLAAYQQYVGPLPDQSPGYLGRANFSSAEEICYGAIVVPLALAGVFFLLGRLVMCGAPRASFARGLCGLTALAAILSAAGLAAAVVPVVKRIVDGGGVPTQFEAANTPDGAMQRFGLAAAIAFALVAKAWSVVALGKMGAALGSHAASARSGRLVALAGLLVGLGAVGGAAYTAYPHEVETWLATNVQPQWDKAAEHKPAVRAGLAALGASLSWIAALRLTGGVRRAARVWLEQHPGA